MDTFLIKATQLILAFAILVIIHEFGHFLFARLFGVKVEKFYIFFNPWTQIAKWKPGKYFGFFNKKRFFKGVDPEVEEKETSEAAGIDTDFGEVKKKKHFWTDTEYGIGWLPLGGYCKIAGMIDESMDTEQMKQPAKHWEFRSKPAWQRLLIMIAGVLFNFLLAIVIYAGLVYATGEKYVPLNKAGLGMTYSKAAREAGFRDGDIPLTADGAPLDFPGDARMKMLQAKEVKVLRGTDTVAIPIAQDLIFKLDEEAKEGTEPVKFMAYRIPVKVTQVQPGDGADKAGIRTGDHIIAIDSVATPSLDVFFRVLPDHDNQTVGITVARQTAGRTDTLTLPVALSSNSKMGIGLEVDPTAFFPYEEKRYSLLASVPRGIEMGTDKLTSYAKSMKLVFTKEGAKSLGGFGTIGSIFPDRWDWIAFWNIAAFLSVALAFMNILPIPALDGGHVMFLLYEVIFRRKPSEKFMEWAQMIGMGLLILLLLYANGMDIIRLFK